MDHKTLHTSSGLAVRSLRDVFRDRSLDFENFLKGFHLVPSDLDDPSKRFDTFLVSAMWEEARELLSMPFLHVEMEMKLPPGAYGALEFYVSTASTMGEGIIALSKYADLWNTLFKITIDKRPTEVEVLFTSSDPFYDLHDLVVEMTVVGLLRRIREQTQKPFKLSEIHFAHPKTSRLSDYENAFQMIPKFESDRNSFSVGLEVWNSTMRNANPLLHLHLGNYLENMGRQFRGTHSDIIGRVRHYVFSTLGEREISINEASKFLGLSPRSLQRSLREADTTFSQVIDEVKMNFAKKWVQDSDLDFSEIASKLGFNDQSAFVKAYRRWTERTPGEDRRRGQ